MKSTMFFLISVKKIRTKDGSEIKAVGGKYSHSPPCISGFQVSLCLYCALELETCLRHSRVKAHILIERWIRGLNDLLKVKLENK